VPRVRRSASSVEDALARSISRPRGPLLAGALVALVILVAVALGFVWRQYGAAKDEAAQGLRSRSVLAATVFDTYFAGQLQALRAMAAAPSVVSGDPERMASYFARFRPGSGTSFTAGVGWIDLTGHQRATSDPGGPVQSSLAGRSYFRETLRTEKPVVGEAIVATRSRRRLVVMGVPTRDERGRINGVLAGGIVLQQSAEDARTNDLGYAGLQVIDRAGQQVTRRDLGRPANTELVSRLRRAGEGVLVDTNGLDGASGRVVAFATSTTPGWLAVLDQPTSAAFADARHALLREVLLVCAGAGLLLLLFGWAVWRSRRDVRASRAQVARWAQLTESLNDAADVTEVREALIAALTAEHPEGTTLVGLTAADPNEELSVVVRRGARAPLGNLAEDAAVTIAKRVADADAAFAVERSPAVEVGLGGETLRTGSLYGVPLRYRDGRPAGSASVAFGRTQALGDHELSLLRAYAHQAEQALGRVRRHEEEHDAAVLLQQSLLPDRLPDVSGVDVAAHYRAGALNTRVGGDWYDVVRRPDGVVHLTVGDVAGRGIDAAISMGQLRNAFRAYALEHVSPAAIVDRLDRHVPVDEMATMVCATFDPLTRGLTYATAGHLPPLLVDRGQRVVTRLTDTHRGPLGWTTSGIVRDASVAVPEDATLALYTDGLVEHRDESIDVGIERLADALLESAGSSKETADEIVTALAPDPEDDLALLLVRLAAVPDALALEISADPYSVRELRRRVHGWLTLRRIADDTQHAAVLALNEACVNAIEHAYRETNGAISIQLSHRGDVLRIAVEDQGTWRQPTEEPNRGRGILLMKNLMSTADIRQQPSGTRVVLEQRL
jgi:serine phosphatase RsbU (regulator of sigma subunit)/anti-sigma regulatory factor (Ser/Thr protein kinase)